MCVYLQQKNSFEFRCSSDLEIDPINGKMLTKNEKKFRIESAFYFQIDLWFIYHYLKASSVNDHP